MKNAHKPLLIVLLAATIMLAACSTSNAAISPYTIEAGRYGLDKAIVTNLLTREETELVFEDIMGTGWRNLLSFSIDINQDSQGFYNRDGNYVFVNAGLAYELIENNILRLHFPRWHGHDNNFYDVVIILGKHKIYG